MRDWRTLSTMRGLDAPVRVWRGCLRQPVRSGASLELLRDLSAATVAESDEVLGFIDRHALIGKDIGHDDVHLLASVSLTEGTKIWTRDKSLHAVAQALGCTVEDVSARGRAARPPSPHRQ